MRQKNWALGTVQFGIPYGLSTDGTLPGLDSVFEILEYALANGINQFDTARAYGLAEERLGQFLKQSKVARDQYFVSTKLKPISNSSDPATEAQESLEQSLQLLQLEEVDVLMVHRWENWKHPDIKAQIMRYKNHFKQFGVSVLNPNELQDALMDSEIKFVQLPFNLIDWRWHVPKIRTLIENRPDVTFQCRSIFLQGLLLKRRPSPIKNFQIDPIYIQLEQLQKSLNRINNEDLCYAYAQGVNWLNSLVFGVDNIHQLQKNLDYLKQVPLDQEQIRLVESTFTKELVSEELLSPSNWTEVKK